MRSRSTNVNGTSGRIYALVRGSVYTFAVAEYADRYARPRRRDPDRVSRLSHRSQGPVSFSAAHRLRPPDHHPGHHDRVHGLLQTTIGKTIYVTRDWDERHPDERYITMCHELIHLRQFERYTLIGMAILYLLLPLPMGLAWFPRPLGVGGVSGDPAAPRWRSTASNTFAVPRIVTVSFASSSGRRMAGCGHFVAGSRHGTTRQWRP